MFIYNTVNYYFLLFLILDLEVSIFYLLSIKPQVLKYCDTVDSIFDYIEISFADQNGRPLEIDDDITVTIIIKNKYA